MGLSPKLFLVLSVIGFGLLWGFAISNGTLEALDKVQAVKSFPDGRPLRTVYSGYKYIDSALTTLVAFFDALCNGGAPGPRLLCLDLVAVIHCADVWAVIDSRRRGVRTEWMRHPLLWIVAWNSFGAAVVLPLYCYVISLSGATKRDPTVPLNEARAFVPAAIAGSFFPLLMFAPAILNWGTHHEHGYVAHYMWATALGYIIVLVIASRPGATSQKDPKNPNVDSSYVTASYMLAGLYSAAVHLYTLYATSTSSDPDISLSRLFVPSPSSVGQPGSNILVEGAHLFTQFDWHVVVLTCMLFAWIQMEQGGGLRAPLATLLGVDSGFETLLAVGSIGATTALLGPGAAGSFSLAVREFGVRAVSKSGKAH